MYPVNRKKKEFFCPLSVINYAAVNILVVIAFHTGVSISDMNFEK